MPPLPLKSIQVAGHRVRLKVDPSLTDWANFDLDKKLISISLQAAAESEESLAVIIKHEVFHAALRLSGVSFTMSAELEEAVVRCMEQIFLPASALLDAKLNSRLKAKPAVA